MRIYSLSYFINVLNLIEIGNKFSYNIFEKMAVNGIPTYTFVSFVFYTSTNPDTIYQFCFLCRSILKQCQNSICNNKKQSLNRSISKLTNLSLMRVISVCYKSFLEKF